MDDRDERQELTDRFRHEIRDGHDRAFFTEGELVEIYDYANDNDDDYIMSEVLFHAASQYPHSEALTVRRAYNCYYAGMDGTVVLNILKKRRPGKYPRKNTKCPHQRVARPASRGQARQHTGFSKQL